MRGVSAPRSYPPWYVCSDGCGLLPNFPMKNSPEQTATPRTLPALMWADGIIHQPFTVQPFHCFYPTWHTRKRRGRIQIIGSGKFGAPRSLGTNQVSPTDGSLGCLLKRGRWATSRREGAAACRGLKSEVMTDPSFQIMSPLTSAHSDVSSRLHSSDCIISYVYMDNISSLQLKRSQLDVNCWHKMGILGSGVHMQQ